MTGASILGGGGGGGSGGLSSDPPGGIPCANAAFAVSSAAIIAQTRFADRFMEIHVATATADRKSTAGNFPLRNNYSRLLIDDLARADRVGNLGEIANVGHRIAIKDHKISVKSPFDPALAALKYCAG